MRVVTIYSNKAKLISIYSYIPIAIIQVGFKSIVSHTDSISVTVSGGPQYQKLFVSLQVEKKKRKLLPIKI